MMAHQILWDTSDRSISCYKSQWTTRTWRERWIWYIYRTLGHHYGLWTGQFKYCVCVSIYELILLQTKYYLEIQYTDYRNFDLVQDQNVKQLFTFVVQSEKFKRYIEDAHKYLVHWLDSDPKHYNEMDWTLWKVFVIGVWVFNIHFRPYLIQFYATFVMRNAANVWPNLYSNNLKNGNTCTIMWTHRWSMKRECRYRWTTWWRHRRQWSKMLKKMLKKQAKMCRWLWLSTWCMLLWMKSPFQYQVSDSTSRHILAFSDNIVTMESIAIARFCNFWFNHNSTTNRWIDEFVLPNERVSLKVFFQSVIFAIYGNCLS